MSYAPGPWAVENDEDTLDQWFIREPEGGIVAVLEKGPNEEIQDRQYDNARLIAAAPDLLAVCRSAANWFGELGNDDGAQGLLDDLHAAIAKAEGR